MDTAARLGGNTLLKLTGMIVTLLAVASFAFATDVQTPEIDANSVGTGLALLSGVLLIARGRRK